MRALIQRVSEAKVIIDDVCVGQIDQGLLLFLCAMEGDGNEDVDWIARKILSLRIMNDSGGKMNHSVVDVKGGVLVVSQFTLGASLKKGNRPSFNRSMAPTEALVLFESFIRTLKTSVAVEQGVFGADMKVHLLNDGPITIWLDSKDRQ